MIKKRRLIVFGALAMILVAVLLCSCGGGGSTKKGSGSGSGSGETSEKWVKTSDLTKQDVYSKLWASLTTVAKDLSIDELDHGSKVLGLNGKVKLQINKNDFWLSLKTNYNYKDRDNAMFSLELSDNERSDTTYSTDDLYLGLYLYKQKLYIAIGTTKFSVDLKTEVWNKSFPFDYKDNSGSISSSLKNPAIILGMIVVLKDDEFVQKKRDVGATTELNFVLDIDTAKTLKKIVDLLNGALNKEISDPNTLNALDEILTGVLGISVEDIESGNIPESSLKVDFTTTTTNKISALSATLKVEDSDNHNTIFNGEDVEISVDMKSFKINNSNVSIPFVNSDNDAEREKYVYFLDSAFRFSCIEERIVDGRKEDYTLSITAKIFQEQRNKNFAFLDCIDEDDNVVMAGAVYNDVAKLFKRVDGELVCTVSLPLDISTVAEKVVANDFAKVVQNDDGTETVVKSEFNVMTALGYVFGALRVNAENISLIVDKDLFSSVWFNFYDALEYLNGLFDEDLFTDVDAIVEFKEYIVDVDRTIYLPYDRSFLYVVNDNEKQLFESIRRFENSEPELVLQYAGEGTDEGGQGSVDNLPIEE
ncbi:MAG: hypothetical protein IJ735_06935 [Clostridia bacterium]|nr:hypothetical protein [Clostridia bacterium]